MKNTKVIRFAFLGVFLSFLSISIFGGEVDSFPGLKKLVIQANFDEKQLINIYYNPALTKVINQNITDAESQIFTINAIDVYLDEAKSKKLNLVYSEGASVDPQFILREINSTMESAHFNGMNIYIPGNSAVYVSGHTDNYFNEHRKYIFTDGKFSEVKQPFLYVGLDTVALKDIKIFADKSYKDVIATIPKNSQVMVLLADGNDYLLKTSFGLVGWFHNQDQSGTDISIKGLYFNGD